MRTLTPVLSKKCARLLDTPLSRAQARFKVPSRHVPPRRRVEHRQVKHPTPLWPHKVPPPLSLGGLQSTTPVLSTPKLTNLALKRLVQLMAPFDPHMAADTTSLPQHSKVNASRHLLDTQIPFYQALR